jgi:hypothetical protein
MAGQEPSLELKGHPPSQPGTPVPPRTHPGNPPPPTPNAPLPVPPPPQWPQPYNPITELVKMFKTIVWSAGFLSFIIVILFSFIIVMAMTPDIQHWITTPTPNADDPSILELPLEYIFIIVPMPVLLFSISGVEFQAWHILILCILFAAFTQAIYGLWKSWLSKSEMMSLSLTAPEKATSSLEAVAKLFMASISFSFVYFIFLSLINVQMNTPAFDELSRPELIYALFSASVFEELISRVLLIGVPLLFIGLALKWKSPVKGILGGGLDITPITLALIAFSAVIFAFAHVGGWDYWKVPQVLIPGFALGWAFVRYGLHASMLIHFSINLSDVAMQIWPDNMVLQGILSMVMLVWVVAGAYFFFRYSRELVRKLAPKLLPAPQPVGGAAPGQYYGYAPPPPGYYHPPGYYAPPPAYPYYPPPMHQPYAPPPQRFCLGCGRQIQTDYNHCPHCGKQVPPLPTAGPPAPNTIPNPIPVGKVPIPMVGNAVAQGGFVCPNCSNTGASYDSGKLTCLKCGVTHVRETPADKPAEKQKQQIEF